MLQVVPMFERPVQIERHVVVTGGCCKRDPWLIRSVDLVDGVEFIVLGKKDPGFCRFVADPPQKVRAMDFLDTLRKLRTEASMRIPEEHSLFEAIPTRAARRSLKRRCADMHAQGKMPDIVVLNLPELHLDEKRVPGIHMKVKASLDITSNVSVELQPQCLDYIWHAMQASAATGEKKRVARCAQGVRWLRDRRVYMATRESVEGGKQYRSFRPRVADDEVEEHAALQRARQWVTGEPDEDAGSLHAASCTRT